MDLTALASQSAGWMEFPLFSIAGTAISLGSLFRVVAIVVGIWLVAAMLERSLLRFGGRFDAASWQSARVYLLSRLTRYAIWILGTIVGLSYMGIDLTSIALLGSALTVGLGFGLQNIFSNFVSGVIILIERSLKIGDFVELQSGVRGRVREIAMRYTRITTNDALDMLIPNSEFINGRVVNWTLDNSFRRIRVDFSVAYGTSKELVREAALAAAKSVQGVIEGEGMQTDVRLVAFGESAMNYQVLAWLERELTVRPGGTRAKILWALDDELSRRNIKIPFPQREIHFGAGVLHARVKPR